MASASMAGGCEVKTPLDEFTLAIAREAAREAVKEHMATCPIVQEFLGMHMDMYGPAGEKDKNPGLMGDVRDLVQWQKRIDRHIGRIWKVVGAIVAAAAGSGLAWFLGRFK